VVTRHLSWFEKQLRDWISSGDALSPALLLTSTADHSILPPYIDHSREPPAVPSAGYAHHDTLHSLTRLCCTLACLCSSSDAERLEIQRSRDQILRWAPPKGFINPQGQVQQPQDVVEKVSLGYLDTLADGLQSFVGAVTGAVPSRFGCNWPGCVRLEGVSEGYGLVRGQACVCGGCGMAR
jgi:hypothetical protein